MGSTRHVCCGRRSGTARRRAPAAVSRSKSGDARRHHGNRLGRSARIDASTCYALLIVNDDVAAGERLRRRLACISASTIPRHRRRTRPALGRNRDHRRLLLRRSRLEPKRAARDGADYIAFGAFFASGTRRREFAGARLPLGRRHAALSRKRAEGAYLWDADGKRYIDYVGSWGPMIAGHAHPAIVEAVREAALRACPSARPPSARSTWPS
jgi:hypothetical protein